jgi:hypothetical protein
VKTHPSVAQPQQQQRQQRRQQLSALVAAADCFAEDLSEGEVTSGLRPLPASDAAAV